MFHPKLTERGEPGPVPAHVHRADARRSSAAMIAETELRVALEQLADARLLRIDLDTALAVTTAMAMGCVMQLNQTGGSASGPS